MTPARLAPRIAILLLVAACGALATGCGEARRATSTQTAALAPAGAPAAALSEGDAASASRSASATSGAPAPAAAVPAPSEPRIIWDPIPFGPRRKAEMIAYARRHYGSFMTVIHYTETPSFQATYNTFAPDVPDPELRELPGTCAHFVIDSSGAIHQLVSLGVMCRHTVGLNWAAIGVEHVGFSDQQVLSDRAQMSASLKLVRWLRCSYHIALRDVIGHNESLSSPYHREDVPALRTQTHADLKRANMRIYRTRLALAGPCG